MITATVLVTLFLTLGMRRHALVPGRWQSMAEMSYEFVANMVRENAGTAGMRYFPFIFTLFMFILFCNLLGLIPYNFTPTSHITVTFVMAMVVFLGVTVIGFVRNGAGFLRLFVPAGVPIFLLPLIVIIEVISYLTRPISLAIRLFANMMAGHTMLKVFAAFVVVAGHPRRLGAARLHRGADRSGAAASPSCRPMSSPSCPASISTTPSACHITRLPSFHSSQKDRLSWTQMPPS